MKFVGLVKDCLPLPQQEGALSRAHGRLSRVEIDDFPKIVRLSRDIELPTVAEVVNGIDRIDLNDGGQLVSDVWIRSHTHMIARQEFFCKQRVSFCAN